MRGFLRAIANGGLVGTVHKDMIGPILAMIELSGALSDAEKRAIKAALR
jgi:hypothetical protein